MNFDEDLSGERNLVLCIECKQEIVNGASLCQHCKSYQDKRRWLQLPNNSLALLTSLISVLALAFPQIYGLFHTPYSDAKLQLPVFDGNTFRVLATNSGDSPAVLVGALIAGKYLPPATKVKLRDEKDAVIPPGAHLLTFDIIPLLDAETSYKGSLEVLTDRISGKGSVSEALRLSIHQANGDIYRQEFNLSSDNLFYLLQANADRCDSIEVPDFVNGCVGGGSEAE